MHDDLPEFYVADGGARIAEPTYQAATQLYITMVSADTGQAGPTLVEPGEHFTSQAIPSHQWIPLNRAANERVEEWIAALPVDGKGIPQELITEAAYRMRPREGEPELPHTQWWAAVMKLAATMAGGAGRMVPKPRPAVAHRPGAPVLPIMPFASQGPGAAPPMPGRAPEPAAQHQPQNPHDVARAARRQRVAPPMPNTLPSESPQTVAG
jgi:hypothetical protein